MVGNGQRLGIEYIGLSSANAIADAQGREATIDMSDVLVVPEMGPRLFSCGAGYAKDGIETRLNGDCVLVTKAGEVIHFTDNPVHYSFCAKRSTTKALIHGVINPTPLQTKSLSVAYAFPDTERTLRTSVVRRSLRHIECLSRFHLSTEFAHVSPFRPVVHVQDA